MGYAGCDTVVYQATRPRSATAEEQLRKLLNLLDGMELTSAGHLTAQNFSFSDEILIENGMLNFYVQADFDVDAAPSAHSSARMRTMTG